jgi:predicted ester cyclase
MNHDTARSIVAPFYDALNVPSTKSVAALVTGAATADWRSYASATQSKSREEFINQVIGFGKGIPNLKWDIKELLVDGDKVIVRSEASGTPAGELFGVPHGGRSFTIMTLDVHTVKDGKLVAAHHVEDWASAIRQLRGA